MSDLKIRRRNRGRAVALLCACWAATAGGDTVPFDPLTARPTAGPADAAPPVRLAQVMTLITADPQQYSVCIHQETMCPSSPTRCPDCEQQFTRAPVQETRCPTRRTQCPQCRRVQITVYPETPTRCPPTRTACAPCVVERVTSRPEQTKCPACRPTVHPPQTTLCPPARTRCPQQRTTCPPCGRPTVDPQWTHCPPRPTYCPPCESGVTNTPVVRTECPRIPTECPPCAGRPTERPSRTVCPAAETQCPSVPTRCPGIDTRCPPCVERPTERPSPTVCPAADTQCPTLLTRCPPTRTRCPEDDTHCPSDTTHCPRIDTRCPPCVEPPTVRPYVETRCPPQDTHCPEVGTECPRQETRCPPCRFEDTVFPRRETECPRQRTECPGRHTVCPPCREVPTAWPQRDTQCPQAPTECPASPTVCPPVPTECPRRPTECPRIETQCPPCRAIRTRWPEARTDCPVIGTLCPSVGTQCPRAETTCPPVATGCPASPTRCPQVPTSCPPAYTQCPQEVTTCPPVATRCPVAQCVRPPVGIPTVRPVIRTQCPLVRTTCPPLRECAPEPTFRPAVATQCPRQAGVCPPAVGVPTVRPDIATHCPVVVTRCPAWAPCGAAVEADVPARLAAAGVRTDDALLARLQSRAGVLALSRQTKVPVEPLLALARVKDMRRALGDPRATDAQIELLRRVGIGRPGDLARYRGRPQDLAALLTDAGRHMGITPPSAGQVSGWLAAGGAAGARLPELKLLMPQAALAARRPDAYRFLAVGHDPGDPAVAAIRGQLRKVAKLPPLMGPGAAVYQGIDIVPLKIPESQKQWTHDFEAKRAGLYRVALSLKRPGGDAQLNWTIQKPRAVLQTPPQHPSILATQLQFSIGPDGKLIPQTMGKIVVTGYDDIIQGNPIRVVEKADLYLFFLVQPNDVPITGTLRLRLEVTINRTTPKPPWKPDPIEQTTTPPPGYYTQPDPTITGYVQVSRRSRAIGWNSTTVLPFRAKKKADAPVDNDPIVMLEAPYYQRRPAKDQPPWQTGGLLESIRRIDVRFEPIPATYKLPMSWQQLYNLPRWHIELLRNYQLTRGKRVWWKGFSDFSHDRPKNGQYSILVSASGPFTAKAEAVHSMSIAADDPTYGTSKAVSTANVHTLTSTGMIYDLQFPHLAYGGVDYIKVTVSREGGAIAEAYVAELVALTVSDQSETGDNDNDEGLGEFVLKSSNFLQRVPTTPDEIIKMAGKGKMDPLPGAVQYPIYKYVRILPSPSSPGTSSVNILLPNCLLGYWLREDLDKYNNLGILFTLAERDSLTWWQKNKAAIMLMFDYVKAVVGVAASAFTGGMSAMAGVSAVISTAANMAVKMKTTNFELGSADDLVGFPCLLTWSQHDYGLQKENAFVFPSVASGSDPNQTDKVQWTDEKNQARGWVSTAVGGSHNVSAMIRLRRAPALYSSAVYRVTGFTLNANMDNAGPDGRTLPATSDADGKAEVYFTRPGTKTHYYAAGMGGGGYTVPDKSGKYTLAKGQSATLAAPGWPSDQEFKDMGYAYQPASYCEFGFWDADVGHDDEFVGVFSHTFYHEDIRKNAGRDGQPHAWKDPADPRVKAVYRYVGNVGGYARYVADYWFQTPGCYLSEVRVRGYLSVWED